MGGSGLGLTRVRSQCFWLHPNVGVVLENDERVARTLAEQGSDLGLRHVPVYYGKVLDLPIGLQHEEPSNLIHPPPPIDPQLEV